MAKRKKLVITREGYLFLAAIGVLILGLIVVAVLTKGFGACSKEQAVVNMSPAASVYHPAPTATPKPTPDETTPPEVETADPGAAEPGATQGPTPTPILENDPNALTEPTVEMIAGAAEGKLIKSGVNMRQGPSTTTPIVASGLKSNTKLMVYLLDGDFYFVKVVDSEKYGYIKKDFVKLLSALREVVATNDQPEGTIRGNITAVNLILRDGPALTATKLGQFYEGKMVYIFYQEGEYYYVQVAGEDLKGYLFAQFVKPESTVPQKDA